VHNKIGNKDINANWSGALEFSYDKKIDTGINSNLAQRMLDNNGKVMMSAEN